MRFFTKVIYHYSKHWEKKNAIVVFVEMVVCKWKSFFCFQESAVDVQELEEALTLIKVQCCPTFIRRQRMSFML